MHVARQRCLAVGVVLVVSVAEAQAQPARTLSGGRPSDVIALQLIDDATDAPLPGVRVSVLGDSTERVTMQMAELFSSLNVLHEFRCFSAGLAICREALWRTSPSPTPRDLRLR